jgi:hypothetical protein
MIVMLMMLIGIGATHADASLGGNQWCWQPASGTVAFCDFQSYGSCMSANQGKEEGTCFRR